MILLKINKLQSEFPLQNTVRLPKNRNYYPNKQSIKVFTTYFNIVLGFESLGKDNEVV